MPVDADSNGGSERAQWMRLLALSSWEDLKTHAGEFRETRCETLRPPETGLVMLRGRMGATGAAFNLGEATVTRCAVRLENGIEGHAYVLGRNGEHARTAAICDALLQVPGEASRLQDVLIKPLSEKLHDRHLMAAGKAAATKVDFFTLVRGDG